MTLIVSFGTTKKASAQSAEAFFVAPRGLPTIRGSAPNTPGLWPRRRSAVEGLACLRIRGGLICGPRGLPSIRGTAPDTPGLWPRHRRLKFNSPAYIRENGEQCQLFPFFGVFVKVYHERIEVVRCIPYSDAEEVHCITNLGRKLITQVQSHYCGHMIIIDAGIII